MKRAGISFARTDSGRNRVDVFSDTRSSNFVSRMAHEQFGFEASGEVRSVTLKIPFASNFVVGTFDAHALHPSDLPPRNE